MTSRAVKPALAIQGSLFDEVVYDRRASDRPASRTPDTYDPLTVSLEPGIALVEASAGTGKTYSIILTVLRLLLDRDAQGVHRVERLSRILVVTFTNAATDELITRLREALREAVDVFSGIQGEPTARTAAFQALRERYGAEGLARLRQALTQLDELSVFTIHGFCKRVLEESALESGTPLDAGFLEDDALLLDRAMQDWWRRTIYEDERLAALAVAEEWTFGDFRDDLKKWRRYPDTRIDPEPGIAQALADFEAAVQAFGAAWDAGAAAAFLAGQAWRKHAPLGDDVLRARVLECGTAFAGGDLSAGMHFLEHCTTSAIRDVKRGITTRNRERFDAVPDEPFVAATDRVAATCEEIRTALRVSCLREASAGFESEKHRRHLQGFDDLLQRLRAALDHEGPDGQLAQSIRRRYDAALIDEFQDTDAYQFPIFSTAFAGRPLFLIGDPKQAIYGFRGADVFAYMKAARQATRTFTLGSNWRSTPQLVSAVNTLFGRAPAPFLFGEIPFHPVTAARAVEDPLAADGKRALHWFFVPPSDKPVPKGDADARLGAATTAEIVRLVGAKGQGGMGCRPGQIAVLVRTGWEGLEIQERLRAANVPCIVSGLGDILQSEELRELEQVLRAIVSADDARAVRGALATGMWGLDAGTIHQLSAGGREGDWQALVDELQGARDTWLRHGFMRMVQSFVTRQHVPERLLALDDGERRLTNLRHAIELLHSVSVEERLSPEGLLLWIGRARTRRSEDAERTELRLESDADAVQVVTIHKSKGLEYDIVFCPGLWSAKRAEVGESLLVHDGEDAAREVVLDHGSRERDRRERLAAAEGLAEDLRLAYVALTRARLRCYVGWGAITNAKSKIGAWHSALGYLLRSGSSLAAGGRPHEVAAEVAAIEEGAIGTWSDTLAALVASSGGVMSREDVAGKVECPRWPGETRAAGGTAAREPLPALTQMRTWRIASYTSLTAGRHVEDARDLADTGIVRPQKRVERRDDIMSFPAGREAGIAMHAIFEHADFAASVEELRPLVARTLARARLCAGDGDPRVDAVTAMAARVLGIPIAGEGFALRDVPRSRTLREWSFELPLGAVEPGGLERLFARHGDALAVRYAPALRALGRDRAWGFLTGVVDLVLEHGGRWYVADWKSNHLGAEPENYEQARLEEEMSGSHYVLQYHLYLTALHRFLRQRLPGYDYEMHMGGALYAFVRGVDDAGRGWFRHRPPVALIEALSALMDLGAAEGA